MKSGSLVTFILLVWCLASCQKNHKTEKANHIITAAKPAKIQFADKLFFIGPGLDSTSGYIDAGCDCCASDIAFFADSSFVYAVYCLEGNDYLKGNYSVRQNQVILKIDSLLVSSSFPVGIDEVDSTGVSNAITTYSVKKERNQPAASIKISSFKEKPLLILIYNEGEENPEAKPAFSLPTKRPSGNG